MTHSIPGGAREIWNDVAAGLTARGHPVTRFVLYPAAKSASTADAAKEGWHHVLDARPSGLLGMPPLLGALVRYLRAARPAVIVTSLPLANVLVPLGVRLSGIGARVLISHHSPTETHNPVIDRLDAITGRLSCVARVISVSETVSASLEGKSDAYRAKRVTIHNALPSRIEALIDRLCGDEAPTKVAGRIVALGRLTYQKNYPLLLRAMAHVPTGTLDIVGAGEDEAHLRALAATCGVAERVRFLGWMTREAALAHAATAEVFAQVSHFEGHSLALIEAARLGLPIVVSNVPVQVEGVTAGGGRLCGMIVPVDDPKALGSALSGLLAEPATRAAWSERAKRLGLEASNQAMIDAYETLLSPLVAR